MTDCCVTLSSFQARDRGAFLRALDAYQQVSHDIAPLLEAMANKTMCA